MPPLTGKAAAEPGGEIRRGEREEFLVRIEPAAVLWRRTCGRSRPSPPRRAESRRAPAAAVRPNRPSESPGGRGPAAPAALRPAASRRARQAEPARSQNAAHHHEQRHGLVLEKNLPENEHRQRGASNRERGEIGFVQVREESCRCSPRNCRGRRGCQTTSATACWRGTAPRRT